MQTREQVQTPRIPAGSTVKVERSGSILEN